MLRCGHTDIYSSKGFGKYIKKHPPKALPIDVDYLEKKLLVGKNRSSDSTIKVGTEILKIDNRPASEIIAQMREMMASDGYNQTFKNTLINLSFDGYYRFLYGEADSIRVTVKDSASSMREVLLKTKKLKKSTTKKDSTAKVLPLPKKTSKADLKG